ncbi:alpha/beta-hydrolase [Aspergillus sclerotioniger CBS 115572]|uniref:Alpha/beta-hydrolase n=1 Tax=Aspergillus sclerotioniger CBS 115572 TaxID=1450535 RepID=A0A317XC55_9EURO|nr:alpha/beta-hydrolase [Aspergillus sclerotioniger CBS 115572]PWY96224.1 alpha/beta-hydrolase [Aspergillus sclerotioniger CBS 115572]
MQLSKFTALALAISLGQANAALSNSTECADVHFMLARGTTESYPGTTYSLAELVSESLTVTNNYESIIYPAVSETASNSYFIGRAAVGTQVNRYAAACPDSRIVLLSYSQGAMIVGDALAGGGGNSVLGNATEPLISEEVSKHIAVNVFYGNPRHVPYEPYDFGHNATAVTGKYPRLQSQIDDLNERYTDVIGDWCNNGDSVCSPSEGADALALHTAYATDYDTIAAAWVLAKLRDE